MEKKRDWNVIWMAVAAVATVGAVIIAGWIGVNANRIADESKQLNERSLSSMEKFNSIQQEVMNADVVKMRYDLLNSEKFLYCQEILGRYCHEFYVMSDKSDAELRDITFIQFHHCELTDNEFCQRYGIKDCDEMVVLQDFMISYDNEKSARLGIRTVSDAFDYYCDTINVFGDMLNELGYDVEQVEHMQVSCMDHVNRWFLYCADHLAWGIDAREHQRKSFPCYFKASEDANKQMIELRNERRKVIQETVKRLKKVPNSPTLIYWQSYLNFINKNDKKGKKDLYEPDKQQGNGFKEELEKKKSGTRGK